MPALAPIPPRLFKRILELHGYRTVREDAHNWALVRGDEELPIILPKAGEAVAVEVMMSALNRARMDNATYFTLRGRAVS